MSAPNVKSEPLTYEINAPHSYFRDLLRSQHDDAAASARLARHAVEMDVELPKFEERARRAQGVEFRVAPNRTPGTGGYGSPPLWLIELTATAPRAARVLADLIPSFNLPKGVSSVNIPRITTGTQAGVTNDGTPVSNQDLVDAGVTSPAVPIAGQFDAPIQLLEQSPPGAALDHTIFHDLASSYDAQLERLLVTGTGTNGQFTGILNLATGAGGVNAVTYTDGSPTPAAFAVAWAKACAQLGDARSLPPEVSLMRTARWAWYGSADTNISSGPLRFLGWPVLPDDAIPATLGTGAQDAVVVCRPSDMVLLESAPQIRVMPEPLSGVLGVRLQLLGYAAALLGRYPTGIATVQGTGTIVQSGF